MTQSPDDLIRQPVDNGTSPHVYGTIIKDADVVYEGAAGDTGRDRITRRLTTPMIADPGQEWHYCIATDSVGRVVEGVAGIDLDIYEARDLRASGHDGHKLYAGGKAGRTIWIERSQRFLHSSRRANGKRTKCGNSTPTEHMRVPGY